MDKLQVTGAEERHKILQIMPPAPNQWAWWIENTGKNGDERLVLDDLAYLQLVEHPRVGTVVIPVPVTPHSDHDFFRESPGWDEVGLVTEKSVEGAASHLSSMKTGSCGCKKWRPVGNESYLFNWKLKHKKSCDFHHDF